ncbi:SPFH domain-containing protein [Sphaerothrix gracilis]|uniref:SPFH domain-containing protein n=1 Tax=Sphaerothrix gracilis TaxID=3151835 RepID=UPI003D15FE58
MFWLTLLQTLPTLPAVELSETEFSEDLATLPAEASVASVGTPTLGQFSGLGALASGGVVTIVVLLLLAVWAYTRVYVITPTNEAFVKTGGVIRKQKRVILNGGCVVLPGFHELTRVPLREISIDVERTGKLAVRTQDYLRADMRVTLYVCISPSEQDVLMAAARLSNQGKITPTDIKNALEKRADDGIRAAAKTKTLAEIDSDKLGFAQEVLNLIEPDLKKVGLTLNNIAISEIEESDTYDTNNFFDAQGVRLRTETIQRSIQQKREVELATQVTIEQKELDAEKRSLQIAQEKEDANLAQQLEVESLKAQRQREIQESKDREAAATQRTKILQEKSVEEEEIKRKLSVQQSQIEADIELEERQKQLKVAQALQKQEAEVAEVNRKKAVDASNFKAQVDLAEAERESKVAQQEAAIAIAERERDRFSAEAERAQAQEAVGTATAVEQAQRQQQLAVIAAEREAQERRIADQNVVEIDVFRRRRQAEIARQAAELEAEAIRTLADAERDKALAEAAGIEARITAKNAISNPNLTAEVIAQIWPQLAEKLPEVLQALAPQPGVIGDAKIYAFPGANGNGNGNGMQDINKLLLSTSGLALINSLLEDGKLSTLIGKAGQMIQGAAAPPAPQPSAAPAEPITEGRSPAPAEEA